MQYLKQILIILFISLSVPLIAQPDILKIPITITIENNPIKDILWQISEKHSIGFSYGNDVFRSFPNKSVRAKEKPLKEVLNELFAGEKVSYKVVGNQIVILVLKDLPKNFTISGYVKEQGSSETLIGVNVYVPSMQKGTATNTYGFYSLTLPLVDTLTVVYSFVGYKSIAKKVTVSATEINIFLEPGTLLDEVVVNAEKILRSSENVQMSNVSIPLSQIKNVPSLLGEKDVFKVLQLMPGVQKGMEGSSGIYVRGGGPDQNLIILDDAIVYNASHLFGFFSLFNGDALKSVELTKGGFPARYGGRLSSVIDMNMKDGNKQEWHGEGGIGLISSRLTVEGPLTKNKSSILLSGRRTYLDMISRPLMKHSDAMAVDYFFYDLNMKINYDFGRKNKLYLSSYIGKDKAFAEKKDNGTESEYGLKWGNATATLRWNHLYNQKLFSNFSLVYSKYNFNIDEGYQYLEDSTNYSAEYNSNIIDYSVKGDFDYNLNNKHWIKTGFSAVYHQFNPYVFAVKDRQDSLLKRESYPVESLETGIYVENTYQPFTFLKINGGLRYSQFFTSRKNYSFLEPRLGLAWRIKNDIAVKVSYASMNQYIHMLSNTGISLPTDLWIPSTEKIGPQRSSQLAAGIVKDYESKEISVSLEGYYKEMDSIITYKEGASYMDVSDASSAAGKKWTNNITSGQGWSYGIELLIQKKTGKFNGWIGYTLSWTKQQFDSVNFGRKFDPRYDRRHDISLVGICKLTHRINLSATWVYATGNAVSMAIDKYRSFYHNPVYSLKPPNYQAVGESYLGASSENESLSQRNNFRMEAYHRLDIAIQFHKQKKWGERSWEISVYNAYNRRNTFFYNSYTDKQGIGKLKKVTLFPIIPSITYSFKF